MQKIIFVYNADSGIMNGMFDFFHKLVKPATYDCSLCMITYNYKGMRNAWKQHIQSLPIESEFYHKNQFEAKFPNETAHNFPMVLFQENSEFVSLISKEELESIDLPGLMSLLKEKLKRVVEA